MDNSVDKQKPSAVGSPTPVKADLEMLFNLSLDVLCIAGLDGYFKHVNPAFTHLLGYRAEDLLSKAFIELVHPDDQPETLGAVEQLAQGLDVVDFENRYRATDGSWHWLAWRATSVPEEGLVFAVARDVTEQRRLAALAARQAAELARSNAELEQFASIASHDLQAPLRGVRHLADWIGRELPEGTSTKVVEDLQTLRERVDVMSELVSDLLAYSRVGHDTEKIERTDTAALVAGILDLLGPPAGFDIVTDPVLPVLETIRTALERVLRNLITNAIEHHDRGGGTVTVSAREGDRHWEFGVSDDGPGIPSEDRENVFEMLWSTAVDGHRGTGMGLALVKRIVEHVGGRIWLEPVDGRGSTFRFTWPKRITA